MGGTERTGDLEKRIQELERELALTHAAAVSITVGIADGITSTHEGRQQLADAFDSAADEADEFTAGLARAIAARLRGGPSDQ